VNSGEADFRGWETRKRFRMLRFQAGLDAVFYMRKRVPLGRAIRITVPRMRELFGPDAPREMVEVTMTLQYCRHGDLLDPRHKPR
jgi:hypothetical protein